MTSDLKLDPRDEGTLTPHVLYLIFIGALLFVSAGTLAWPAAWIYLGLTAIVSIGGGLGSPAMTPRCSPSA